MSEIVGTVTLRFTRQPGSVPLSGRSLTIRELETGDLLWGATMVAIVPGDVVTAIITEVVSVDGQPIRESNQRAQMAVDGDGNVKTITRAFAVVGIECA